MQQQQWKKFLEILEKEEDEELGLEISVFCLLSFCQNERI